MNVASSLNVAFSWTRSRTKKQQSPVIRQFQHRDHNCFQRAYFHVQSLVGQQLVNDSVLCSSLLKRYHGDTNMQGVTAMVDASPENYLCVGILTAEAVILNALDDDYVAYLFLSPKLPSMGYIALVAMQAATTGSPSTIRSSSVHPLQQSSHLGNGVHGLSIYVTIDNNRRCSAPRKHTL